MKELYSMRVCIGFIKVQLRVRSKWLINKKRYYSIRSFWSERTKKKNITNTLIDWLFVFNRIGCGATSYTSYLSKLFICSIEIWFLLSRHIHCPNTKHDHTHICVCFQISETAVWANNNDPVIVFMEHMEMRSESLWMCEEKNQIKKKNCLNGSF